MRQWLRCHLTYVNVMGGGREIHEIDSLEISGTSSRSPEGQGAGLESDGPPARADRHGVGR